ncbi:hypothetical protein PHMEG_0004070 [Phytophthora megakarya]|uniref:Uncharacterized protein n=1 Tax=Phytophthora megakarya TaxID=4795 RepID=A0A225WUT4_9STRA|nr:hypothetical protein PHMEG_0004070 [Phytophthora megakarya]
MRLETYGADNPPGLEDTATVVKRAPKAKTTKWQKVREWVRDHEDNAGKYAAFGLGMAGGRGCGRRTVTYEEMEAIGFVLLSAVEILNKSGPIAVDASSDLKFDSGADTGDSHTAEDTSEDARPVVRHQTGYRSPVHRSKESWKRFGVWQDGLPPFDFVEEFTDTVAKVLVVWELWMETQYGQIMVVEALVVEGAAEDWMVNNGAKHDFPVCEMKRDT